jgi:hypothetical protein
MFHPNWLSVNGLITREAAQYAIDRNSESALVVSAQFTSFVADWLTVQVRQEQMILSIVEVALEEDLRDFADGIMSLVPETPIDAMGINFLVHYRILSEAQWHAFGDLFLPKDVWESVIPSGPWVERKDGARVGLRNMTVEVQRGEDQPGGLARIDVAPSVRVLPWGIFCQINDHFAVPHTDGSRGSAGEYALLLRAQWSPVRSFQAAVIERIEGLL